MPTLLTYVGVSVGMHAGGVPLGGYTFTLLDANSTVLLTTSVVVGSQLLTGLTPGAMYTANIVTNNSVGVSAPAAFSFYAASTDPVLARDHRMHTMS